MNFKLLNSSSFRYLLAAAMSVSSALVLNSLLGLNTNLDLRESCNKDNVVQYVQYYLLVLYS